MTDARLAPLVIAAAVVTALAALLVPKAFADADPASDVLLTDPVYFSYDSNVSGDLKVGLADAVAKLNHKGYRLKVAVIESKFDLGGIVSFFAHPKQYARFLGLELRGVYGERLLVAMPNGFGTYYGKRATKRADAMLRTIRIPSGGDGLLSAATAAVKKLGAKKPL